VNLIKTTSSSQPIKFISYGLTTSNRLRDKRYED